MRLKTNHGFTLVEIMVAMLVLAIGLLGLAGLQANGLRQNTNALYRTFAMMQAYDMADRIRVNVAGREAGAYDSITTGIPGAQNCTTATCLPNEIAAFDAWEWNTLNSQLLPSGTGSVSVAGVAPNQMFTVTVMWDEERTGATGTNCGGNPAVDLKCYSFNFTP
jgi:type IV pilus assembly protein PilV